MTDPIWYLTKDGDPIKLATFESYAPMAGADRPKTIRIQDAKRSSDFSLLEILSLKSENIPDSLFQASQLGS